MGGTDPRAVPVGLARLPDPSVGYGAVESPFAPDEPFPELTGAGIEAGSTRNASVAATGIRSPHSSSGADTWS
jgi:hypothetical protein